MITLVTCFYLLKSKFNRHIYENWFSNFLPYVSQFNLVIFCDENSNPIISKYTEGNNNIKIILLPVTEFYNYKYKDHWIKNHEKNHLLNHNSSFNINWQLNMLWSEKISFVKRAYDKQYFNSEWFGWCDIGYFREDFIHEKIINENEKLHINNEMSLIKATYGDPNNPNNSNNLNNEKDVLDIINNQITLHKVKTIKVNNDLFGDPCFGILKSLKIKYTNNKIYHNFFKRWPNKDKINLLDNEKIYYALVNNDSNYINMLKNRILDKNKVGLPNNPIPSDQMSIAGGFFLISKNNINWWHKTYDEKLYLYFNHNYLVKDDQIIIIDCLINNDSKFTLFTENNHYSNWFMFQRKLL